MAVVTFGAILQCWDSGLQFSGMAYLKYGSNVCRVCFVCTFFSLAIFDSHYFLCCQLFICLDCSSINQLYQAFS